ncbi:MULTISPECIES: T9SS type A sorting domain-containing protein [Aequorivita]|uniref:T9SS type A sorting domain-containing protein n=2 Tax=Aequorivita TaxID=153265 RepID=A0AB35YVN8_9FLAO|nr:T9SS type A sorting domain-containing protein [Aequorivita sp. Ant34-E75]WGF92578.1 T9SS type A sorting domain-containing protein [Aequorivita sp. Ant34-E75]
MKKTTLLLSCFVAFTGLVNSQSIADLPNVINNPQRTAPAPAAYFNNTNAVPMAEAVAGMTSTSFDPNQRIPFTGTYGDPNNNATAALVYDNGLVYNIPGPPMVSMLQDASLGMSTYGFGAQFGSSNSMADDMVLTGDFDITSIDVYAYQTGSAPPTIDAVYLQVWDGDPSGGGASVIWGDLTTNILDNTVTSDAFRQLESAPGDTSREIQLVKANTAGLSLTAGTYWIEYSFGGTGASGPWAPPIVITGDPTTGNALQNLAGVYGPAMDGGSGTPQGMPFQVYGDPIGGGGGACQEENPNDGTFENGFNCSSASAFMTANDVTVAAGEDFELTNITASIFANGGITNVDVNYYDDAAGLPGNLIGSQASATIDNQTVIGNNFGFDVNEIELTVTPFTFAGQAGSPTTYWVELSVTDGGATGSVFWVVTSSTMVGNPSAQFDAAWGIPDPLMDGVYIWEGNCNPLGVSDNALAGFSYYPNPVTDVLSLKAASNIEAVSIYNLLGQEVLRSEVGATTSDINLSGIATGAYVLKVTVNGQTGTYKILKN